MNNEIIGSELKCSYYNQACRNLDRALSASVGLFAGHDEGEDDRDPDSATA